MTIEQHRNKEMLGGVVTLLTIDATGLTGNAAHIRRYVNHFNNEGEGVTYQGIAYTRHPYEVATVKRSAKSNRQGSKVQIANSKDFSFSRFVEDVGGDINGARIYEYKVYERYLDNGVEPNILAYIKRLDHKINYVEDSDKDGEVVIHTIDPLSRDILVPSIAFSAGVPNDTQSYINVFPAADRTITEGR